MALWMTLKFILDLVAARLSRAKTKVDFILF